MCKQLLRIDSLCIIQDDPDDLKAQISLMGAIFEGANCIIAAIDAKAMDPYQTGACCSVVQIIPNNQHLVEIPFHCQ